VIVESMSFRSDFTSRRSWEKLGSNIGESSPARNPNVINIGEDSRLKEIDGTIRVFAVDFLLEPCIEWRESIVIELPNN